MMFMLWVSERPDVYGGEGISDILWDRWETVRLRTGVGPIPTGEVPPLSGFILAAEWSLTHVTFSDYRAFSQLSEA